MPNYSETYLEKFVDGLKFFIPDCEDRRYREIQQRTKFCYRCQGFEACQMYPGFWLAGAAERNQSAQELQSDPSEGDLEEYQSPEEPEIG